MVPLLSVGLLNYFSLFFLARLSREGCLRRIKVHSVPLLLLFPKVQALLGALLCIKKNAKTAFPSAESCNFGRSFRGNVLDATKPMGKRLTREEGYIAPQGTAVHGGGSFACVLFFCRAVPSCGGNVGLYAKTQELLNSQSKSTQCAQNTVANTKLAPEWHKALP